MRDFYYGFEKAAGKQSTILGKITGPLKNLKRKFSNSWDTISDYRRKHLALTSEKDVMRTTDKVRGVAEDTLKNTFVPEMNKLINKAQKKPFKHAPDLSSLATWKGGVLTALTIGASLEAGRRGVGALADAPGYIKNKMEARKNK